MYDIMYDIMLLPPVISMTYDVICQWYHSRSQSPVISCPSHLWYHKSSIRWFQCVYTLQWRRARQRRGAAQTILDCACPTLGPPLATSPRSGLATSAPDCRLGTMSQCQCQPRTDSFFLKIFFFLKKSDYIRLVLKKFQKSVFFQKTFWNLFLPLGAGHVRLII